MQLKYDMDLIKLEKTYVKAHGILFDLMEERDAMISAAVPPKLAGTPTGATPGLPHVPLLVFDGSYENWFKFKTMFTDVMAKYPNETDAVKLYHLEKALTGKAVGAIDQQTLKDNNYAGAWKILTERFENRRTIIDIHTNGILNLKCIWQRRRLMN